jgi:hypothetical protein
VSADRDRPWAQIGAISRRTAGGIAAAVLLASVPVVVPVFILRDGGTATLGTPTRPDAGPDLGRGTGAGGGPTDGPTGSPSTAPGSSPTGTPTPAPVPPADRVSPPPSTPRTSLRAPATPGDPTATRVPTGPAAGSPGAAANAADLVVVSVAWSPSPPVAGDRVTFRAVIRNAGNRPTDKSTLTVGVAFLVGGEEVDRSGCNVSPVAPGEQLTCVAGQDGEPARTWTATRGAHRITVVVDDIKVFAERSETNNSLSTSMSVA